MARGEQLEALVRRLDRALNSLEADALGRLSEALRRSEAALEELLRPAYARALGEVVDASTVMREARARLLLEQVRAALDITSGASADDVLRALVSDAYEVGAGNALDALSLYQREVVSLSSGVRADVLARATNASARLSRHGREFAEKAEQLIIDGITRGRGWSATARELRRETRSTLAQAEMIVRTESITASDDARRAAYQENGVEYVQRMATMDERVCGYCAYRAGNVYRVDEAPVALHPNDRCFNAPWKPEWQELGLTDDEWQAEHKAEALRRSDDIPRAGAAPFEKAESRQPPTPVWTPRPTPPGGSTPQGGAAPQWAPVMAPGEARRFTERSAYQGVTSHVTSPQAAASIKREGFRTDSSTFGRLYGDGVYLALDDASAEIYRSALAKTRPAVSTLRVRVNVQRPLEFVERAPNTASIRNIVESAGLSERFSQELLAERRKTWETILNAPGAELGRVMAEPTEWANGTLAFAGKLPDDIVAARSRYFKAARAAGRYNPDPVAAVFTRVVREAGYDSVMIRAYAGDVTDEAFRHTGGNQLVVFDARRVVVVDANAD